MKDVIKKFGAAFYLSCASAFLSLISTILFAVTNGIQGFAVADGGLGIALIVLGLVLAIGSAFSSLKFGSQHFLTAIFRIGSVVLMCVSFGILLADRVGLASSLFTWDSHNEVGWTAFYISVASAVLTIIAVILLVVSSFFGDKKEKVTTQIA